MAFKPEIGSDLMHQAMLNGLTDMIRKRLRERILERIEPDINAAIDAALDSLKTTIETWRSPEYMRDTIKVLVEHKPAA